MTPPHYPRGPFPLCRTRATQTTNIGMSYHGSMYPNWYAKVSAPFRSAMGAEAIRLLDRALVLLIAVAYVVAMAFLAITDDPHFLRMLIVPAVVLVVVSALRQAINAPRPYELYDIDPILEKDTQGKSLPSRHVACATIIACGLAWFHADWGVIALIAAAGVAFTRIVGGVHFPRDVIVGAALAIVCALVGFVLIP